MASTCPLSRASSRSGRAWRRSPSRTHKQPRQAVASGCPLPCASLRSGRARLRSPSRLKATPSYRQPSLLLWELPHRAGARRAQPRTSAGKPARAAGGARSIRSCLWWPGAALRRRRSLVGREPLAGCRRPPKVPPEAGSPPRAAAAGGAARSAAEAAAASAVGAPPAVVAAARRYDGPYTTGSLQQHTA